MKPKPSTTSIPLLLVLSPVLLAGCGAAPRMQVPGPLTAAPEMPVVGRQAWTRLTGKPMTFGTYRAEEIHLGWRSTRTSPGSGWGLRVGNTRYAANEERTRSRQRLEYRLVAAGAAAATVQCLRAEEGEALVFSRRGEDRESTLEVGERREIHFACAGEPEAEGLEAWSLALDTTDPRYFSGTLTVGETAFVVDSTNRVSTGVRIPVATGFVVQDDGRPVAAVDVIDQGIVWIDPQLAPSHRTALAGAGVALLLLDATDD